MKTMKYIEIDGHANLSRDMTSHGVINTNKGALQLAKERKAKVMGLQNQVDVLTERIGRLEKILLKDDGK